MRIVIAEDQFLLRQGLENLFTRHGFEVVAAVDDGPSLTDAVLTHRPDVALIDIRTPGADQPGFNQLAAFLSQTAEHPDIWARLQSARARANYSSHGGCFHSCHL